MTLQVRDPILPPFFSPFQRKDPALGCAKITTASSRTGMSQGHRDVRGGTLGTRRGSGGLCSSGSGLSPAGTIPSPPSFPGFILGQTPAPYPLHKGGSGGIWESGSFLRTPRPPSVARGSFPMEGGGWGGRGVLGSGLGFSPAEMSFPQPHPGFMDSGPPSPFSSCEKGVILGDRPFPGDPPWEGEGIGAMLG